MPSTALWPYVPSTVLNGLKKIDFAASFQYHRVKLLSNSGDFASLLNSERTGMTLSQEVNISNAVFNGIR